MVHSCRRLSLLPVSVAVVLAAALSLSSASTRAGSERQVEDVSLVQLLATPERFHGKRVQVIGFLRLEFEGDALYLHQEDYRRGISKNAIWVDLPDAIRRNSKKLTDRYVIAGGTFDSSAHGHMGMFSGTLKIVRLDVWR